MNKPAMMAKGIDATARKMVMQAAWASNGILDQNEEALASAFDGDAVLVGSGWKLPC